MALCVSRLKYFIGPRVETKMPTVEEWELADDVLAELSKYRAKVTEARNKVESEKNLADKRPPSYLQNRAIKTIDYHDKILQSLDGVFAEKKEKLEKTLEALKKEYEDKLKALEKAIEDVDVDKEKKKQYHEVVIEEAKKNLDFKPITLIRAEDILEKAIIAKDKFLESAKLNHVPEKKSSVFVTLPPYKRTILPIVAPVQDDKLYYDPEGNICSKWEYEMRQKKIEREETHKATFENEDMCVSPEPLRQKKPLKTVQKRIDIQDEPNSPRSEAIVQDIIKSLNTPA
jgi:hypothetical protein